MLFSSIKYSLLMIFISFTLADPPDWVDIEGAYEFTASMTAGVYDESGAALGDTGDILAAFDSGGNVRGISTMLDGLGPSDGLALNAITIRSNAAGEEISFQYYDASEDIVLDIQESYTFVINDLVGNLFTPHELQITDTPEQFRYEQSSQQAFYFFTNVTINGMPIEPDDWVGVFNGSCSNSIGTSEVICDALGGIWTPDAVCVGARLWDTSQCGNDICEVPAMGDDGSDYTEGYCYPGDIPTFKIYDISENEYYDAEPAGTIDMGWANNGTTVIESLIADVIIFGCTNPACCNYNPYAVEDDGSCNCSDESCYGCTDEQACNFVPGATIDDDGCWYEGIYDCDGNCMVEVDCANVCDGSAVVDECGVCGGSGIPDAECDCHDNVLDACGVCGGNGTAGPGSCDCDGNVVDCSGVCGGSAVVDECGVCGGSGIQNSECDCQGHLLDDCGVCGGNNVPLTGTCDCAGIPNGDGELDACGECNGGNADDLGCGCFEPGPSGCDNECGSTAELDICGVCGGSDNCECPDDPIGTSPDCMGVCGGYTIVDGCGICGGTTCTDSGPIILTATVENYDPDLFAVNFESFIETQLGLPEGTVSVDNVSLPREIIEIIVTFSITLTESQLGGTVFVGLDGINNAWTDLEASISIGGLVFIEGCSVFDACNYDSTVTIDNGSCTYTNTNYDCAENCCTDTPDCGTGSGCCISGAVAIDCNGECAGSAAEDNCNICDVELSNDCVQDCAGEWGGILEYDECGICGGDNSTCADCAGFPNGDNLEDHCGTCDADLSNDCVQDCNGEWGGPDGIPVSGDEAVPDECGVCGGSGPPEGYSCDLECISDVDCSGVCGGDDTPQEVCQNEDTVCQPSECLGILAEIIIFPDEYGIQRIFPNPFNPVTHIQYAVVEFSKISVRVYDIRGRMIKDLYDGHQPPGIYNINWNASEYASGVYFIETVFQSGSTKSLARDIRKILYLK